VITENDNRVVKVITTADTFRSYCALITVAVFVTFVIASAPHRVHHLLENLPAPSRSHSDALSATTKAHTPGHDDGTHDHGDSHHTHDHGNHVARSDNRAEENHLDVDPLHADAPKRDAHHDNSAQSDCVMQAAAQHAHALVIHGLETGCVGVESAGHSNHRRIWLINYNPAPFSQRAPPRI
jgi:hypothetical protein